MLTATEKKCVQGTCQIFQMVHVFQEIPNESNKIVRSAKNPDLGILILTFMCPQFTAENNFLNNDGNPTIFSLTLLKRGWNDPLFLYIVSSAILKLCLNLHN